VKRLTTALLVTLIAALLGSAEAPAQAEDTLETIKARHKLIASVKNDTPPFGYLDEKNEVVGFDVDLVREIAKALGVEVELVKVASPTRIPLLVSGNVDLSAASMTHTREREGAIDFSITYYTGAQTLLVPNGSPIRGLKDLAGKTVAVQQGTTLEKTLALAAPEAKIQSFRDYTTAWLALRQGRADAFTGSYDVLRGFAREAPGFQIVGAKFSLEPFGIGMRHGDWQLRNAVNAVLQDLWISGRYQEIYRKWFQVDPDVPIETWPKG
jgi:polar amino acid transport system substrate-binding protein